MLEFLSKDFIAAIKAKFEALAKANPDSPRLAAALADVSAFMQKYGSKNAVMYMARLSPANIAIVSIQTWPPILRLDKEIAREEFRADLANLIASFYLVALELRGIKIEDPNEIQHIKDLALPILSNVAVIDEFKALAKGIAATDKKERVKKTAGLAGRFFRGKKNDAKQREALGVDDIIATLEQHGLLQTEGADRFDQLKHLLLLLMLKLAKKLNIDEVFDLMIAHSADNFRFLSRAAMTAIKDDGWPLLMAEADNSIAPLFSVGLQNMIATGDTFILTELQNLLPAEAFDKELGTALYHLMSSETVSFYIDEAMADALFAKINALPEGGLKTNLIANYKECFVAFLRDSLVYGREDTFRLTEKLLAQLKSRPDAAVIKTELLLTLLEYCVINYLPSMKQQVANLEKFMTPFLHQHHDFLVRLYNDLKTNPTKNKSQSTQLRTLEALIKLKKFDPVIAVPVTFSTKELPKDLTIKAVVKDDPSAKKAGETKLGRGRGNSQ